MKTNFWRFAYDETQLKSILNSNELAFPDFSSWRLAKNNREKVLNRLRVDHFILLANFNATDETGIVKGVGKIISIEGGDTIVSWKKAIPSWTLTPDRLGGVPQWKNEA